MPSTSWKSWFTPYLRIVKWATILYKNHDQSTVSSNRVLILYLLTNGWSRRIVVIRGLHNILLMLDSFLHAFLSFLLIFTSFSFNLCIISLSECLNVWMLKTLRWKVHFKLSNLGNLSMKSKFNHEKTHTFLWVFIAGVYVKLCWYSNRF